MLAHQAQQQPGVAAVGAMGALGGVGGASAPRGAAVGRQAISGRSGRSRDSPKRSASNVSQLFDALVMAATSAGACARQQCLLVRRLIAPQCLEEDARG
jgi:phage tail tape-measure protein